MNKGTSDLPSLVADEYAREAVRTQAHGREMDRSRGVSWSGLTPDPLGRRTDAQIRAAAIERLQRLQAWRRSGSGRFLAAIATAQRAAENAHYSAEAARAALARGLEREDARCRAATEALEAEGRALMTAARAARRALRSAPAI